MFDLFPWQIFIECKEVKNLGKVLEVLENVQDSEVQCVGLENRDIKKIKKELWYCKKLSDESFVIISVHNGKALKVNNTTSQVVFSDNDHGEHWEMREDHLIRIKGTSKVVYVKDETFLYCGDENASEVKNHDKSFKFQDKFQDKV